MATDTKPPPTTPLNSPTRLLVALAALGASTSRPSSPLASKWLGAVCKAIDIDPQQLPSTIDSDRIEASASDQRDEWTVPERERIASVLIEASLATEADGEESIKYSPWARAYSHDTLRLLGLDLALLPVAEKRLGETLFNALKEAGNAQDKVESTRAKHAEGWGGSFGRKLATGAGVIAGGVLIGVTGGLAAPAIAAVLAPLGIGGILGAGAAPVVLGTLFGVGGGGLAGRRVRERWRGVEEFSFVEVGAGTKVTKEEAEELIAAKERYKARVRKPKSPKQEGAEVVQDQDKTSEELKSTIDSTDPSPASDRPVDQQVVQSREQLEERLLNLSIAPTPRQSLDLPALDAPAEEADVKSAPHPPSLTATIVVPGLLTVSRTEAITAWRSLCSTTPTIPGSSVNTSLSDGRDVYLCRFESAMMLKTGRDIDHWVTSKLKGKIKSEIIKRTLLNAYFAAVSLPLTVYSMASMSLDNTWMQAQDRASKAGRILGEVIEQRIQGERPVTLIGSSLGALTVFKALLYLADKGVYVDSAILISLPAAPTADEWAQSRKVVARRFVNAYSGADWVLAGVVRLHEVISRAATLNSGISPAGLGPVDQPGVENVDVSEVLQGHMELQAKMGDILDIIKVDA